MNKIYKVMLLRMILLSSCMFFSFSSIIAQNNEPAILNPFGDVEGWVTNGNGQSIAGATVGVDGYGQTTTNPVGYYLLEGLPVGQNTIICYKDGYNTGVDSVIVIQADTVNLDYTLTQPNITVVPSVFSVTLNPNEFLTQYLSLLNVGDGECEWTAVINYPSSGSSSGSNVVKPANIQNFSFVNYTQTDVITIPGGNCEPMNARSGFDCPDQTVFSHPPLASDNGYSCEEDAGMMCYQSFSGVTESITTVTIYAIHTSIPSGQRELLCEVYGPGSTPGTIESSTIVMADPVSTGIQVLGYDTYSYTFDIPKTDLSEGWIGIQATSGGSPIFYWLNTYYTPSYTGMQNNTVLPTGLAMCLSSNLDNWLTLDDYEGTVSANGGAQNVGVNFNALDMNAGEVYTAEIVITTQPDVGTFNIPVTMTIAGVQLYPVYNLRAELVNMVTGQIDLDWMFDPDGYYSPLFKYFLIEEDGVYMDTTIQIFYSLPLSTYGIHCYTVLPVFTVGNGVGETTCIEWEIPSLCWNPNIVYNEQWINSQEQVNLTIENCGLGMLDFIFPDYISGSRFACYMQVALYDTYGDGWNGGSLDVFVNGILVLNDITINNGGGPEYFTFPVESGDDISTIYTAGQWSYENYYEFYDGDGILLHTAADESVPEGIVFGTCSQPSFILDVEPAMGQVPAGQSMDISITYDATGFSNGLYNEWLEIWTNDPLHQEDSIFNQMFVYTPGTIYGYVHDCNSGLPMPGVTVWGPSTSTSNYTATTNATGYYEMEVDEDTYDIDFSLLGFESVFVADTFITSGVMTEISICMSETPYPVPWVLAEPDENAGTCLVTWGLPMGPYEIIYDDGYANDFVIWTEPGNIAAVKFTPVGYPATIIGGRFNVGDGSFPSGSNFIGSSMTIMVMDDDGANGFPGTILDSSTIIVDNYGWIDFYGLFDATIEDGEFFIVLKQTGYSFNSAPIGVDTDLPTVYRSYVKLDNGSWTFSPYQDFMIRAYIDGPNAGVVSSSSGKNMKVPKVTEGPFLATNPPSVKDGTIKDGEIMPIDGNVSTRDLEYYTIARISDFDPNIGPQSGVHTPIANPATNYHVDFLFSQEGFYAYAVLAVYTSGSSELVYSNTYSVGIDNEVTIVVSLCNDGDPDSSEVYLAGLDYPYQLFDGYTDATGIIVFDSVIDGMYNLLVSKPGYEPYGGYSYGNDPFLITNDTTIGVELLQKMYPPINLEVDPLTSIATWDPPLITQLYLEDFENDMFPPEGWQANAIDVGWFRSEDAGSGGWPVPPGDGFYAAINDDVLGSGPSNSSMDYLITPQVDLRESEDFQLYFDQFYDGSYGHSAYVEYSHDQGTTWELIETMSPNNEWNSKIVNLGAISGPSSEPVMLAFHGDDHGTWASGWAVDNVEIKNGPAPLLAYYAFLNNQFFGQLGYDATSCNLASAATMYGQTYEFCLLAVYDCGSSDPVCTTWESTYLSPPLNLTDEYLTTTDDVPLKWNPPAGQTGVPDGLVSFNIYRDSLNIDNVIYEDQAAGEWVTYIDTAVPSNDYSYWVSAIYELDIFGYPGDYAESAWEGPDNVSVAWGSIIPFFEDWGNGTFAFNNWTLNENSANWSISSQEGEPAPSAEFTWDPLLENDYSSTLTSYPIQVDYITEGDLFLTFDLKLIDRNSTGNEHMLIEIFDGTTWHLAADFSNGGKTGFTVTTLNITQYADGNAINIRFNASGQNSFDIVSWFVDNINVYRECVPPENLVGYMNWNSQPECEICWDAQNIPMPLSEWIHWDSGENYNSVGLTDGGTFSVAARWDESQLAEYDNASATKVRFVPLDGFTEIIIKIWIGDNAETLIYSEDVTTSVIPNEWNEYVLSDPILIDADSELWVGYTVTHVAGTFPAGADEGPANYGYGDMISTDGSTWDPVSSYGLDYNWNIQVFVMEQTSGINYAEIFDESFLNPNNSLSAGELRETPILIVNNYSRNISGFNIYRLADYETEYQLYDIVEFVSGQSEYCYHDEDINYLFGSYYQVTANYVSETDECESMPAMAYEIPSDDFVYILFEDIESQIYTNKIIVFPNPTKDELNVRSKATIESIRITNYMGQIVYTNNAGHSTSIKLNTSTYPEGVYLIQVETKFGITTKRVIINR